MLFRRRYTPIGASVISMRGMGDDGYGDASSDSDVSNQPVSILQTGARAGFSNQTRKQAKRISAAQQKQIQEYLKNRAMAIQRQAIAERALALRAAQIRAAQQQMTLVSPIEPMRILGPSTPVQSMVVAKTQSTFTPNVEFNQSQKDFEANYARTLPVQELNDMYLRTGDAVAKTELDRRGPAAEVVDLNALEESMPLDAIGALTRYASHGIPKKPESDYEFTVEAPDIQVNPLELIGSGKSAFSSLYRAVKGLPSALPDIPVDQWLKQSHEEVPNYDPTSWLPDFSRARRPAEEESFADNIKRLKNAPSGAVKDGGFFDVFAQSNRNVDTSLPVFEAPSLPVYEKSVHEKVFADLTPEERGLISTYVQESERESQRVRSAFALKSSGSESALDSIAGLFSSAKDRISESVSSGAENFAKDLISGEVKSRLSALGIPSDSISITRASYDPSSGDARLSVSAPGGYRFDIKANYSDGNIRIDDIASNKPLDRSKSNAPFTGDIQKDAMNYALSNQGNQISQLVAEYNSGGHGKAPFQNWESSEYEAPQYYLEQTRDGAQRLGSIIRDFADQYAGQYIDQAASKQAQGLHYGSITVTPEAVKDASDIAKSNAKIVTDLLVKKLTPGNLIQKADQLIGMQISKGDDQSARAHGYRSYEEYVKDVQKTDDAIRNHYKDTYAGIKDIKRIIDTPGSAESKFASIAKRFRRPDATQGLDALASLASGQE